MMLIVPFCDYRSAVFVNIFRDHLFVAAVVMHIGHFRDIRAARVCAQQIGLPKR